jgi:hypothetical protein
MWVKPGRGTVDHPVRSTVDMAAHQMPQFDEIAAAQVRSVFIAPWFALRSSTSGFPWVVHLEFWQKVMGNYDRKYLLVGTLAGSMTSTAVAAQSAMPYFRWTPVCSIWPSGS